MPQEPSKKKPIRNHGLDLLRIISMLFVVTLHVLGHGGVLDEATGTHYAAAWLLETASYCAVDCFVLISGFVMMKSSFKSKRIIGLWLEAFFYGAAIALLARFQLGWEIGREDFFNSFSPS